MAATYDLSVLLAVWSKTRQVDLPRMVAIITTSTPWIVNIYAVQLLLMFTFTVLGTALTYSLITARRQ